ncbi:phosphoenolpyruvate carboxylase [Arachidicoccus terrestris]|uniref:phosphoenolpyruvate carboxylase n=1 Tax=Arachidicoccus terrestris TaxID=2875539 RepID=UPI001CC3FA19|nr:phosphoenolpyruvate carboxylase [Arachidicoccus terrestris]UAY54923.1 phosphoenolpyruvate carboxylase [Arachidicoccus terrestris]
MQVSSANALSQFKNKVGIRFQLYNSLFTSLPFHRIEKTGVLLSLFLIHCEEGFKKAKSPEEIIDSFLQQYTNYPEGREQLDLLFRFIQYAERQVVLFDALEDASFDSIQDLKGQGTMRHLASEVVQQEKQDELAKKVEDFSVRLVLTAHPTQFYPGEVLGIINDLSKALVKSDTQNVNVYLQQLAKTPFLKKQKPTPFDEAMSLIWYLENVFYQASGKIIEQLKTQFPDIMENDNNALIHMGFWPGGDRDGNPFVRADTTLQVAEQLHKAILHCYYKDIRRMKRRLTFKGVEDVIAELEKNFYALLFDQNSSIQITQSGLIGTLKSIRSTVIEQHNGMFVQLIDDLIGKIQIFGVYFATLDIRQDSSQHKRLMTYLSEHELGLPAGYNELSEKERIKVHENIQDVIDPDLINDELLQDIFQSMQAAKTIQERNGEEGCNRYIISHCMTALDMMEVYGMLKMSGWQQKELKMDIVPLFETIEDLQNAAGVMEELYSNKTYRAHLSNRGNIQTIMLGFSDGTKDGGYLMANWSIYQAKEALTAISRSYDLDVVFFDGRGGPPARGGGKTHKFYASMGNKVSNKEIQLTIQGQTVSSNFGTVDSAKFNIEQLLNAGIANDILSSSRRTMTAEEEEVFKTLSEISFEAYCSLKNHPSFLDYLSYASPLRFYGATNIGSRPTKRNAAKLTLDSLRAIPFVGSWSQLKQNVTGYYGVGTALLAMEKAGRFNEVRALYKNSLFFRALIENSEMSMKKCFFPLTKFQSTHPKYGELWNMAYEEYLLSEKMVLKLTGNSELMESYPVESLSIQMRERIVLPLLTIQQYGLAKHHKLENGDRESELISVYEKLIMRCSFGIINAGRNSA